MLAHKVLAERGPIDFIDLETARKAWADFRAENGRARSATDLLTKPDDNQKFAKTGAATYGLSLAPSTVSGFNTCPFSTRECRAGCVAYSGMGRYDSVTAGRVLKTQFLMANPEAFLTLVAHEIYRAWAKHGIRLRVRLNTFSDLPWEEIAPTLFERFPLVRFYDYTKNPDRAGQVLPNYWLTYSASERFADEDLPYVTGAGVNVAVVFSTSRSQPLPMTYQGVRVIDGDKSDDRTLDPTGVIVGLRAKGSMRTGEKLGMVREIA